MYVCEYVLVHMHQILHTVLQCMRSARVWGHSTMIYTCGLLWSVAAHHTPGSVCCLLRVIVVGLHLV